MLLLLEEIYYILKICETFFIFLNDLRALHTPKPFNIPYKSCYTSLIKFALSVVFSVLLNYVVLDNVSITGCGQNILLMCFGILMPARNA